MSLSFPETVICFSIYPFLDACVEFSMVDISLVSLWSRFLFLLWAVFCLCEDGVLFVEMGDSGGDDIVTARLVERNESDEDSDFEDEDELTKILPPQG